MSLHPLVVAQLHLAVAVVMGTVGVAEGAAARPGMAVESQHGVAAAAALGVAGGVKAAGSRAGSRTAAAAPPPPLEPPPTAMPDQRGCSCSSSLQHGW